MQHIIFQFLSYMQMRIPISIETQTQPKVNEYDTINQQTNKQKNHALQNKHCQSTLTKQQENGCLSSQRFSVI